MSTRKKISCNCLSMRLREYYDRKDIDYYIECCDNYTLDHYDAVQFLYRSSYQDYHNGLVKKLDINHYIMRYYVKMMGD